MGDLALGPIEKSLALTEQRNGRKFLVPGNHDRISAATQTKKAIGLVVSGRLPVRQLSGGGEEPASGRRGRRRT